jgi:hypothetical protein
MTFSNKGTWSPGLTSQKTFKKKEALCKKQLLKRQGQRVTFAGQYNLRGKNYLRKK